jgi:hypothetical protein
MKYFYFLLTLLFSFSCSHQKKENNDSFEYVVDIPSENFSNNISYSSLLEDYYFVPLDTATHALIARIDKLVIEDGKFFILDSKGNNKILVFNEHGKYLYSIGTSGNAGNEYVKAESFTVDAKNKQVIILDMMANKLLYYQLTGEFIRTVSLSFSARAIETYKGNLIFNGWGTEDRLIIADINGKKMDSYFPYNIKNDGGLNNPYMYISDTLLFRIHTCDTIYAILNEKVFPSRFIDFGDKALTWNIFEKIDDYNKLNISNIANNHYSRIKYYVENRDFCCFLFFAGQSPTQVIYNKQNGSTTICPFKIDNDITFEEYIPIMEYVHNDYFVGEIEPYSLLKAFPEKENVAWNDTKKEQYKKMEDFTKNLTEDDNTILFFVRFKK